MKIFIDPDDAKRSNFGAFYQPPIIDATGCRLPVSVPEQLKSRWCWAAIASALATYYQTMNISQVEIADSLLSDNLSSDPVAGNGRYANEELLERNVNFKLDVALKYVNCFSHWTIGKPIFERVQFEINQGRPLGVRLEWFKGGAHYILVNGYCDQEKSIMIEDPLHGKSIQVYDQFPDTYRESGAVWTESFFTNKLTNNI
ncbi:papain-like cysteine protease family protein [Niastella caeni]|nr:papain-like cysteine protease family protein [Niastella caeni]